MSLHDLVLRQSSMSVSLHAVAAGLVQVLDETQVQWSTTILVALKLGDCRLSGFRRVKADDAGTPRPATGLVLDLGLFDLANRRKELNQVIVAG
jgi:hypothetical protein